MGRFTPVAVLVHGTRYVMDGQSLLDCISQMEGADPVRVLGPFMQEYGHEEDYSSFNDPWDALCVIARQVHAAEDDEDRAFLLDLLWDLSQDEHVRARKASRKGTKS